MHVMGAIAQTVSSILGEAQVVSWEALTEPLKQTVARAIAPHPSPACIAYPATVEQLAATVSLAHREQWRVLSCGNGTKLDWGGLIKGADLVISTQRLNRLIEHAVGDLTVTAEAGVTFASLQARLLETRQFIPIDPAYAQQATLGGIVATRDTHALRHRYGGIRDLLIGVSFVRHDGQMAKAGGRVVKNVAGYDLMKLMTGSFGTLGMLTQLTFRTYPLPETSRTILLTGKAKEIQTVKGEILLSSLTPIALDLLSPPLVPNGDTETYGLALQFQSIEAGVQEQVARLQAIAAPHAVTSVTLSEADDAQFWQSLNSALFPPARPENGAIAQLGVLPAHSIPLLTELASILTPGTWQARIHASSGIGTLRLATDSNSPDTLQKVRSHCQAYGGYLTLLIAPQSWKSQLDPWALNASTRHLMAKLQEQFDPNRRLNPGRFF